MAGTLARKGKGWQEKEGQEQDKSYFIQDRCSKFQ